eukprot:5076630-Pleurochrysis_carterae.AAC.3
MPLRPASASVAPPPPPAQNDNADYKDGDDGDMQDMDAGAVLPEVEPTVVLGCRQTALRASVLWPLKFHAELATLWDDDTPQTREDRGKAAAARGKAKAETLRAHSGDSAGHYYMHLSFAKIAGSMSS